MVVKSLDQLIFQGDFPTPFPFQMTPALLVGNSLFPSCRRHSKWLSFGSQFQTLLQELDKALQSRLPIGGLTARFL